MARFRRRRHSRGRSSSRRTRWTGVTWALGVALESFTGDREWASFWVKWPASMAKIPTGTNPPIFDSVPTNEPVDETLVRTLCSFNGNVLNPGSAGVATNPANVCFGIIPFSGGEQPDFYDFAIFDESTSVVSPPNPVIQLDDPWVFRFSFLAANEVQEVGNDGNGDKRWDVRSMRKLPAGVGLLGVLAVTNFFADASSPVTFNVGGEIRIAVRSGFSI